VLSSRARRQAIFLGATEPRAARPERSLCREGDASRPRQSGGVNQRTLPEPTPALADERRCLNEGDLRLEVLRRPENPGIVRFIGLGGSICSILGIIKGERKNEIGSCRSHAADCRGNSRRCTAIPVVSRIGRCNKPTSATSSGFGEYGSRRHLHVYRNPCP